MNIDKLLEIYDRTVFNNNESINTFIDTFTDLERDKKYKLPIFYIDTIRFLKIGNIKSIEFTTGLISSEIRVIDIDIIRQVEENLKIETVRFKLIDKVTKNQDQLEEFLIREILENV